MRIIVQKYGGSSVATPEAIRNVALRVVQTKRQGFGVVAVVSAMGHATDHLLEMARAISPDPSRRELDRLLATGEEVSMSLLSMAIQALGESAISLTGEQCGIVTNGVHTNARILEVRPGRVLDELRRGKIVVAAGFQGLSREGEVTTLGRGGSDTTAVALSAALSAEHCEIYTDVDGVFSADPRSVPAARRLGVIAEPVMQELAWQGAQVLKAEAVEFARDNEVTVHVLSTFGSRERTVLERCSGERWSYRPRRSDVAGVAARKCLVRVAIRDSLHADEIFASIARYDLLFASVDSAGQLSTLFLSAEEIPEVSTFKRDLEARFPGVLEISEGLGSIGLVGFGLGSRPDALHHAMQVIRKRRIRVLEAFTGRESLVFIVPVSSVDEGVLLLHRAFVEEQAVEEAPIPA